VAVKSVVRHAIHATEIRAEGAIVAERQDFFTASTDSGGIKGSRTVMGSSQAEATWYIPQISEGTLALTNPGATTVQICIVLYREAGAPLLKRYTLAAHQSQMIRSANLVSGQQRIGLVITASSPVIAEYDASGY
jgi:hypothetical protein